MGCNARKTNNNNETKKRRLNSGNAGKVSDEEIVIQV